MQTYKDFAPTAFDSKGAFLPDRQDWVVVPLSRTRDSESLEESNFDAALAILGGESETVEVHRFGHWGPGWFEIILAHPSRLSDVEAIVRRLDAYPVLDEDDHSQREWDALQEAWRNASKRERIRICARFQVSIFAARRDELTDPSGAIYDYLRD